MKKGMNRRAEEGGGATLGTIITVLLLVLLLVVVVWSFTSSGKEFWSKTGSLKGGTTLDAAVQGCQVSASSNAVDSFCSELKSIDFNGTSQYMTCAYIAQQAYGAGIQSGLTCNGNDIVQQNCKNLKKTNVYVNGKKLLNTDTDCTAVTPISA